MTLACAPRLAEAALRMRWRAALAALATASFAATVAFAAPPAPGPSGPPNALQGFSQNRREPIQIQSATLELRDKEKIATFSENVHLVQGDTTLECRKLVVYYGEDAPAPGKSGAANKTASAGGPALGGTPQQIQKLEATGGVIVTQKDQTATGDTGLFDMKTNSVTLVGNVVVTQGQNVLRGDRLWVDLNTGVSRVESGAPGGTGRVQGIFQPSAMGDMKPAPASPAAPPAAAGAKPGAKPAGASSARPAPASPSPSGTTTTGSIGPAGSAAPKPSGSSAPPREAAKPQAARSPAVGGAPLPLN